MTACDFLDSHQIPYFNTGIVRVFICIWYFVLAFCTVAWLKMQSQIAMRGDAVATRAVMFPVFANIILFLALSDVYFGIILLTVKMEPQDDNDTWILFLFSVGFLLQHVVSEGIAVMLMQKGCGVYAAQKAAKLALVWGLCTLGMVFVVYSDNEYSVFAFLIWNLCMVILYSCLWLLPSHVLYRRPSVFIYAKIFLSYRLFIAVFMVLMYVILDDSDDGRCIFFVVYLTLDAPVQFLRTYLALLEDSRWWQGIGSGSGKEDRTDSKSPLHGFDVSLLSAQELAKTLDHMSGSAAANLINFAHIYLDKKKLLGFGSFSKVYEGKYKLEPVAIKLIFTMDLTESDIQRVAAEATILSSICSKNIVKIYGVTVLPPSVCLVLELCAYGSLSDILRSSDALKLSTQDRMYLALGCSRGVAALHSLNKHVVHRDIKSFNFLVDDQLNAKLADLELGADDDDDAKSKQDNEALFQDDFLFNWLAPEVLQSTIYTQESDIYSLSLVLWEIISGEFPFSGNDPNEVGTVREQIIQGKRPDFNENGIPLCSAAYEQLVSSGWSLEPSLRPKAVTLVTSLERLWQTSGNSRLEVLQDSRNISTVLSTYLFHKSSSNHAQDRMESSARDEEGAESKALFKPFTDNEKSNNTAEAIMESYEHLAPLRDLYMAINNDPVWKIARSSSDPLIVISGQAPHIIMLLSTKFESLTGLRQKSCFGLCFEDFVTSPKNVVDREGSNQKVLSDFYVSLKLKRSAHMVLNFLNPDDDELSMSIHAMPIYSQDSVEYSNSKNMNMNMGGGSNSSDIPLHSTTTATTTTPINTVDMDSIDFSSDNTEKNVLYYILEMNYLERIYNETDDQQLQRNFSTSSMASKLSGLFKARPMSPSSRHMSMQQQSRSSSFGVMNKNADVSNMMRTSYSSGNLTDLKDSLLVRDSMVSISSDQI